MDRMGPAGKSGFAWRRRARESPGVEPGEFRFEHNCISEHEQYANGFADAVAQVATARWGAIELANGPGTKRPRVRTGPAVRSACGARELCSPSCDARGSTGSGSKDSR